MSTEVQRERELKFEVATDFEIPSVDDLAAGGTVERRTVELSSTYYDTVGLDLLAHRVTLRRRTGEDDNGWQLKVPAGNARNEIRLPLSAGGTVPDELRALLAGIVGRHDLVAVATLDTERRLTRVGHDGGLVVEIADDRVTASTGGRPTEAWREVEVELGAAGDEAALAAFAGRLHSAGATDSPHPSKLGRAVGRGGPAVTRSEAGTLVADHLEPAFRRLVAGDIALRGGDDGAVRTTRIAVHRIRSVLRVFVDALAGTSARALDAELSWYESLLGEVRDRQVLRERVREALAELPGDVVLGSVPVELDATLRAEQDAALAAVVTALGTNRYRRMLATVATLLGGDPVASGTTVRDLQDHADRAAQTASRRLTRAGRDDDAQTLHRARRAVRRARHAAELVAPVRKHGRRTVTTLAGVQDMLGAHQDAVTAAATLRRIGGAAGAGDNTFAHGLLFRRERDTALRLRREAAHLTVPT